VDDFKRKSENRLLPVRGRWEKFVRFGERRDEPFIRIKWPMI
jgi:hypothetical protein